MAPASTGARSGVVVAVVTGVAVAAGVLLAGWSGPQPVGLGAAPQRAVEAAHRGAPAAVLTPPVPSASNTSATVHGQASNEAPLAVPVPPPGLTTAQWLRLQRELADQPAELQRVVDHLVFADVVRQFREQASGPAAAVGQARALALAIDQGLDSRLAQREMSLGEAHQLKAAVLNALHGEGKDSQAALARWLAAQPTPQHPGAARELAFQRQQAALVAAWSAQPAAQRDRQALEAQLEALRRSSFAGAP
jgi:hypothetical protein